jgi:hypothetical protein
MDKPTKWLRLQVSKELYNELTRRAKEDDRELPTFLRRHLEYAFPLCSCGPDPAKVCAKCIDYVYLGTEIRTDRPAKDFQIQTDDKGLTGVSVHGLPEEKCMFEGADPNVPMNLVCPCGKCSPRC